MKKTIAFVLAFAMAFATAFSAVGKGVTASAAAGDEDFSVTVDTDGSFVALGVNTELQVGVVTINKKNVATVKNWDTYTPATKYMKAGEFVAEGTEGAEAVSCATGFLTLTPKKDMVVAFRTVGKTTEKVEEQDVTVNDAAYTAPIFWEIQANSEKYKAKVVIDKSADNAKITVNDKADGFEAFSATLGGSAFSSSNIIDERLYNVGGAIQVTPKGKKSELTIKNTKFTYLDNDSAAVTAGHVIQSDAKTVTVKLKKRANGPKVAINYAKGTVTIPKDTSYRIVSTKAWGDFTSNSSKKIENLPAVTKGVVQVKKAATDKALSSKVGVSTFARNTTTAADLEISYTADKGLKIDNKYAGIVEYYIGTTAPNDTTKWSKYKKEQSATIPPKKVKEDATIYYRRAGIAAECKTPGQVESFVIASVIPVDVVEYEAKGGLTAGTSSVKDLYTATAAGTYVKCADDAKAEEGKTYYEAKTYTYTPVADVKAGETVVTGKYTKEANGFVKIEAEDTKAVAGKIYYTKAPKA